MATTCELIAKSTLGADAADVTFSSIPATADDLLLVFTARSDRSGQPRDESHIRVNGDTGSNYSSRLLFGSGSTVGSASNSGTAWIYLDNNGPTTTADTFSNVSVYIPNYAGSTNKSASAESVYENNGTLAYIKAAAYLWSSTAAITSLKIYPEVGPNWVTGSSFFLYGITKA
jgi:hypothetical protein